jgi:hypothetical protein
MLTKLALSLGLTALISATTFTIIAQAAPKGKPAVSNFEDTYKQMWEAGCAAIANGDCYRGTYDTKTEFKDLITKSFNQTHGGDRLELTAKWNDALDQAEYFLNYGAFNESGSEFLDAVQILRESHQIKAIFAMQPGEECDESESCLYMFFFIYLKDGTYFRFEWNQTT